MKKLTVYLATPYCYRAKSKEIGLTRPDYTEKDREIREQRFRAVNEVALKLIKAGFGVISPISQFHPIAVQCGAGANFDFWEAQDYNLILRSDIVMVFCQDGWEHSDGVEKEITFAKQNNIPVFYIDNEVRLLEV